MALQIKRKEKETPQSLIRRFTKAVQQSGVLVRARKSRFRNRPQSKKAQKRAALRKEKLRKQYQRLQKLGQNEQFKR